jgi:hypothetical protein
MLVTLTLSFISCLFIITIALSALHKRLVFITTTHVITPSDKAVNKSVIPSRGNKVPLTPKSLKTVTISNLFILQYSLIAVS